MLPSALERVAFAPAHSPAVPTPTVCAVVVTYNRAALLAQVLDGLRAQTRPPDAVLVVDNASTDGTADLLAERYPSVRVRRLDRNAGASGGFAEGVRAAHADGFDWIWILDDDVVPRPDCLGELLAVAAEAGTPVAVPRRIEPDGSVIRAEAVIYEADQVYRAPDCGDARWCLVDLFTFEGPLVHRRVVDAIGLPDASLFILTDDTDYGVRLYRALGPLAAALAMRAAVDRKLAAEPAVRVHSRLKQLVTGDPWLTLVADDQHWKRGYYLRNRHLLWKRRRLTQLAAHAGYLVTDALYALRHGWDWRLRFGVNARAFGLGLLGRSGAFVDPAAYHARRKRRAGA